MKINAPMLFFRIQHYFTIEYSHITQNNYVSAPMFYSEFFDMNEHIVLIKAENLDKCLQRVQHSIILSQDPPEKIPEESIGTNDLIILNDPMSEELCLNILNHILEYYQEFENKLNTILYTRQSFQDMIEVLTDAIELPLSLTDNNFRYIAYSHNSGKYIGEYVTEENELPEEAIAVLQNDKSFRDLEKIPEAFVYRGSEPLVCKNIYHEGKYVGRLGMIIPNSDTDLEYTKAIFDSSAFFIEALYDQYSSFSNISAEYRKVHEFMREIFGRRPADKREFLELMQRMSITEEDDLAVFVLLPDRRNSSAMFNPAFICEHLERLYPGCFCIAEEDRILVLASLTFCRQASGRSVLDDMSKEISGKFCLAGKSRVFHSLSDFDVLHAAFVQALFAAEQASGEGGPMYLFDHCALRYLLQHGAAETNFLQFGHPALVALKEHDDSCGTCYLETLRVYMDLNMNAVAAARKLYIHRSSFIGRMERMNRLISLNLDDPEERLYINLTFAVFL